MKWFRISDEQIINTDNVTFIEKQGLFKIIVHYYNGNSIASFDNTSFRDSQFEWLIERLMNKNE